MVKQVTYVAVRYVRTISKGGEQDARFAEVQLKMLSDITLFNLCYLDCNLFTTYFVTKLNIQTLHDLHVVGKNIKTTERESTLKFLRNQN